MKVGIFVSKEDMEWMDIANDIPMLTENGYKFIILETTPVTYKTVRKILENVPAMGDRVMLSFPISWKKELYPLDTVEEFIVNYGISTIFIRVYEERDNNLDFDKAAKLIANIAPERTYLFGAISDPTNPETSVYKLHNKLTQLLIDKSEGFSPILFSPGDYTTSDWFPAMFIKDMMQETFDDTMLQLGKMYEEIFLFPYSEVCDMIVPGKPDVVVEKIVVKDIMICTTENRIREGCGINGRVSGRIQVGAEIEILERKKVGDYDVYGRITDNNTWVVLRYKGKNYYEPLE